MHVYSERTFLKMHMKSVSHFFRPLRLNLFNRMKVVLLDYHYFLSKLSGQLSDLEVYDLDGADDFIEQISLLI